MNIEFRLGLILFNRLVILVLMLTACSAGAQLPTGGSATAVSAAFVKLFGTNTSFKADVDTQVMDKQLREYARLPMQMSALEGKVRLDIDMEKIKSKELPEYVVANLKSAGMGRPVTLILPEKKASYVIYPEARSYLFMPMEKADAEAVQAGYRIEKTAQGKEPVNGQECARSKVVINSAKGRVLEATVWEAAGLRHFPVQVETRDKDNTMTMRFSNVQFVKGDAARFELPKGYTEYKDAQEMLIGIMGKAR